MTQSQLPSMQRVRIASHVTQSRFLHVEDALNIGKIRLFAGAYRRTQGMSSHSQHFVDLADARVVFAALAAGKVGFSFKEYKGTPPANGAHHPKPLHQYPRPEVSIGALSKAECLGGG